MKFPSEKENADKSIAWKVSITTKAYWNTFQPQLNYYPCLYYAQLEELQTVQKICSQSANKHVH